MPRNTIAFSVLLAMLLAIAACSSDNSGSTPAATPPPPPAGVTISGAVVDGPVAGATISVYSVSAAGVVSTTALATVTTSATGTYSLTLPAGTTGAVLLTSTGGTFTDDVTGNVVNAPTLSALIPNVSGSTPVTAQLTPLTTMAAQIALATSSTANPVSSVSAAINTAIGAALGGQSDIVGTPLVNVSTAGCATAATQASVDASLVLAGIAQLAATYKVSTADVIQALVVDIESDNMFDGMANGVALTVPLSGGTVQLCTIEGNCPGATTVTGLAQQLGAAVTAFQKSGANTCGATESSTQQQNLANAPPAPPPVSKNYKYSYTLNSSLSGTTGSDSVRATMTVNLTCPSDAGNASGAFIAGKYVSGSGAFSVAGGANGEVTVSGYQTGFNALNDCGNNTWLFAISLVPSNLSCSVTGATRGTFSSSDGGYTNVAVSPPTVSCTAVAPPTYSIGGTVSGLPSGASLVLSDTINKDTLTVTTNGSFTLPTTITSGQSYNVTASLSNCTVTNGSGTVGGANVTSIGVTCTSGGGGGGGVTSALNAPKGIAWGNNLLYVPNSGSNQVLVLSEVLNTSNAVTGFKQMASITQDLNTPVSAALDPVGNLYVANKGSNTVTVYNTASGYQEITASGHALISGGHLNSPSNVTVDSTGNVYVTNSAGNSVSVYQPVTAGTPSAGFNEASFSPMSMDAASNAFSAPQVIFDAHIPSVAEYIVVGLGVSTSPNTLLVYKSPLTNTTAPSFVLQTAGCTTPSGPTGIGLYVDPNSPLTAAVYISSVGMSNNEVFEYEALTLVGGHGGTCVAASETNSTAMNLPFGVAVDPFNNVFVANAGGSGPNANTLTVYSGAGFNSSEAPYFTYSPVAALACNAAPSGKGGGAQPYDNQSYCVSFSGTTDILFTFTGTLTFTTPMVPGALTNCAYFASGTVSAGGATGSTGVVGCTGTTDANGNLHVTDAVGNALTGTFSTNGMTVSGNYNFGEFGPGAGIAAGTFTGTEQ